MLFWGFSWSDVFFSWQTHVLIATCVTDVLHSSREILGLKTEVQLTKFWLVSRKGTCSDHSHLPVNTLRMPHMHLDLILPVKSKL